MDECRPDGLLFAAIECSPDCPTPLIWQSQKEPSRAATPLEPLTSEAAVATFFTATLS
jgi:hypothetical protein